MQLLVDFFALWIILALSFVLLKYFYEYRPFPTKHRDPRLMWLLVCRFGKNPQLDSLPKDLVMHIALYYMKTGEIFHHYQCNHRLKRMRNIRTGEYFWVHDSRFFSTCALSGDVIKECRSCKRPNGTFYGHRLCPKWYP